MAFKKFIMAFKKAATHSPKNTLSHKLKMQRSPLHTPKTKKGVFPLHPTRKASAVGALW